VRQKLIFV